MTPAERAKAIAQSVRLNALDDLETTARLAIRAAVEDERHAIIQICMEVAKAIDPNHGGDAIRDLATRIWERNQ